MSSSITVTPLSGFERNKPKVFESAAVTIGTDAGSDLRYDPSWDKAVSGSHARVVLEHGGCWLIDASSRGGTFIDGEKVQRRKITTGTVIELGKGGPRVKIEFSGAPAPAHGQAPAPGSHPVPGGDRGGPSAAAVPVTPASNGAGALVGGAVAIIVIAAALGWFFLRGGGDPADQFSKVVQEKQGAVGVLAVPNMTNPSEGLQGNGTAWAVAPRVFVANTALVWLTSELMGQGIDSFIVVKGEDGPVQLRITGTRLHPRHENPTARSTGRRPKVSTHDMGLLLTEGDAPDWFEVASEDDLLAIAADMPIGFMAHTRAVSLGDPTPRSGTGKVVDVSDFFGDPIDAAEAYLIEYELAVESDMSGGPIFNADGEVLGVLTIPMNRNPDPASGDEVPKRYGQRIDILRQLWPDYPSD